jgi:hypothetical protein
MASTTGIELGPDSCVLVAVRPRRARLSEVSALQIIERAEWPLHDAAIGDLLRRVRQAGKFPKKARIVAWTLPDGATPDDPAAAAMLAPVIASGFRVDALLPPAEALRLIAVTHPRADAEASAAWVAVNVQGAAIAIVRGGELLFSRTFGWSYDPEVMGTRAQLLQRYSLVAHLGPEIRRGIAAVRAASGATVTTVITCGDLPELRSLTMPLIEELDLEVETLDSTEGLRAVGKARLERFAESAPAIRLACAAALSPGTPARGVARGWVRAAAGFVLFAALGWGALAYWTHGTGETPQSSRGGSVAPAASPARSPAASPARSPAVPPTLDRQPPPSGDSRAASASAPESAAAPVGPSDRPSSSPFEQSAADHGTGTTGRSPAPAASPVARDKDKDVVAPPRKVPEPGHPPARAPGRPGPAARAAAKRLAPLDEPLPRVDSILVDQDRRLAIIDGLVVKVGDSVGSREVTGIEPDGIALRERSGIVVRLALRPHSK